MKDETRIWLNYSNYMIIYYYILTTATFSSSAFSQIHPDPQTGERQP